MPGNHDRLGDVDRVLRRRGRRIRPGALRGAGNTHAGLIVQIVGYWIIGLPIGYLIAFRHHHGAVGLWLGLCAGLIVAGTALTTIWHHATKKLRASSHLVSN